MAQQCEINRLNGYSNKLTIREEQNFESQRDKDEVY